MTLTNPAARLKGVVKRWLPPDRLRALRSRREKLKLKARSLAADPMQFERRPPHRECPICGYHGRFWSFGSPPRAEALCPGCLSLERHRLLHLLFERERDRLASARRILHFAPEAFIRDEVGGIGHYVTVDVATYGVDCACAMEALPFPAACFGVVIANHVLEHVSDERGALAELKRIVTEDGVLVLSVPQVQGWENTYEDAGIVAPEERRLHFGQDDHRRLYGRDFAGRLQMAGFTVETFQADPRNEVRYGLNRGEALFVAQPKAGGGGLPS